MILAHIQNPIKFFRCELSQRLNKIPKFSNDGIKIRCVVAEALSVQNNPSKIIQYYVETYGIHYGTRL